MGYNLLCCFFLLVSIGITAGRLPNMSPIRGDVALGVVLPVRLPNGTECSSEVSREGTQFVLAIREALDDINRSVIVPISIGAYFLDDCFLSRRASKFVAGYFQTAIALDIVGSTVCSDGSRPLLAGGALHKVVGVISGAQAWEAARLASVASVTNIPMVSYRRTSNTDQLRKLQGYLGIGPRFLQSPPKNGSAQAMCELLGRLGWTYVSLVSADENESWTIRNEFETCLNQKGICLAVNWVMRRGSDTPTQDYEEALQRLRNMQRATAVFIVDPNRRFVDGFFAVVKSRGDISEGFRWFDVSGSELKASHAIPGTITVQPRQIQGFKAQFARFMRRGPSGQSWLSSRANAEDPIHPDLIYAREAVYAFAYALKAMHAELCKNELGTFCEKMKPTDDVAYQNLLYSKLKDVQFQEGDGTLFYFHEDSGRADLVVKEYVEGDEGGYWNEVGFYTDKGTGQETTLDLERSFSQRLQSMAPSVCSLPCPAGQKELKQHGASCCWICVAER